MVFSRFLRGRGRLDRFQDKACRQVSLQVTQVSLQVTQVSSKNAFPPRNTGFSAVTHEFFIMTYMIFKTNRDGEQIRGTESGW